MISHTHKCIFIHIPKSGGTSITKIIWPSDADRTEANLWMGFINQYHNKYQTGGLQHLFASQVKKEVGEKIFEAYFKFSVVRNPWDKAVSQYSYIKKRKDLRDFIGMGDQSSFKEYLSLIQKKEHVQWSHQYKFIYDENGDLLINSLGRFEELNNYIYQVRERLRIKNTFFGFKKRVPHLNKSKRISYKSFYDDESREMIAHIYQKDIEIFNYKF